jgi:hypothetical protein
MNVDVGGDGLVVRDNLLYVSAPESLDAEIKEN